MNIQNLFTKHPLYEDVTPPFVDSVDKNLHHIGKLLIGESTFDMHCVECGSHSVFKQIKQYNVFQNWRSSGDLHIPIFEKDIYLIAAKCSRNELHVATIFVKTKKNEKLCKIGQFPALADILTPDLKRYKPAINEERVREWSRAIGLTSHGIGAGAFVYLRRILESLIEDAHQLAVNSDNWNEDEYKRSRFVEKIQLLAGFLPEVLVDNKSAYSVLSKGVHELDEQTCLSYFPVLNAAIELIAEEKLAKHEIEKRKKATQDAIQKIANEVK